MPDIRFRLTHVPRGAAHQALRVSILKPLCPGIDISNDQSIKDGVHSLITRWRLRINQLQEAGWAPANNLKNQYMRNCPPVTTYVAKTPVGGRLYPKVCTANQVCPWCWGRSYTSKTWDAVLKAMKDLDCVYRRGRTGPYTHRLILYRWSNIHFDSKIQPVDSQLILTGLMDRAGNQFAKGRVAMAALGAISPVGKRWKVSQRVLALIPEEVKPPDDVLVLEHPTLRNIATVVGKFSRYPSGLLNGNIDMLMRHLKRRSQFTFFRRSGLFRVIRDRAAKDEG